MMSPYLLLKMLFINNAITNCTLIGQKSQFKALLTKAENPKKPEKNRLINRYIIPFLVPSKEGSQLFAPARREPVIAHKNQQKHGRSAARNVWAGKINKAQTHGNLSPATKPLTALSLCVF